MKLSSGDNWFDRNPKKTLFFVLTFTTLVLLIGADILIGRLSDNAEGDQNTSSAKRFIGLREHPINLNWTLRPNYAYMKWTDSLDRKDFRFRTDEHGFILPTKIHSSPDITLIFLGGSTTETLYVNEMKRFPYLVGRLLEKKTNLKINSYNGGVGGNNTLHSINILINKVIPLKPEYVVLMHNVNDLSVLMNEGTYWNDNPSKRLIVTDIDGVSLYGLLKAIKNMIFPNLYNKLKSFMDVKSIVNAIRGDEWTSSKFGRLDSKNFLTVYEKSLHTFIDIGRNWNITPILMTQMNRINVDNMPPIISEPLKTKLKRLGIEMGDYIELFEGMQEVTRSVAKKRGVLLVDLEKRVPKEQKYIYDLFHLNTEGSEFVAGIISEEILAHRGFKLK